MKPFALWPKLATFFVLALLVHLASRCEQVVASAVQQEAADFERLTEFRPLALSGAAGERPRLIPLVAAESGYNENSSVNILCTVSQGHHETLRFDWFKDGQPLEQAGDELGQRAPSWAPRIEKHPDHSLLRIASVKAGLHSGRYTCAAKSQFGQDSSSVNLLVNVRLQWAKEPPSELFVSLNQELKVDCQAQGEPDPSMRWERLESLPASGSIMQQQHQPSRQPANHNSASSKQTIGRLNQLASSGGAASASAQKVANSHQLVSSSGQLLIQRARELDSGFYECIASNSRDADLRKLVHVQVRDAIRRKLSDCLELESKLMDGESNDQFNGVDQYICDDEDGSTILAPVYYNMSTKMQVFGAQPINQTNILVVYSNGDIQNVNIGQDILQSSLRIKRKAIRMLGLGYNSDARAVHWKIDGSTGICYFETDATSAHMNEHDPLTDIVLSSPTHKLNKRRANRSEQNAYNVSPCIQSRKYNEQDRLVPTQVINMIASRADQYKRNIRIGKWSSITSLNLIYRKLALYDLVRSDDFKDKHQLDRHQVNSFKLNNNRLAVGGYKYALRVYDVSSQKAIYNCLTGSNKGPLVCSSKGEPMMVGDLDWLGGNKTTRKSPDMLATCSGIDSVVNVYDLRSVKPAFHIDLTNKTESKWQPYDNYPRGCMFTSICASGAPYSTAVPSQQLALGSTNGQLHLIDLRFVAKSNRTLGRVSGFCGGSIREIRFVSESFETTKMVSCASDRFVRIHKIQTSYTSVISQRLAAKVFLGTRPTCVQPVCDEISQERSYLADCISHYGSESQISTQDNWSL